MKKIIPPKREKYIDGIFSVLYGFNWKKERVVYRQVLNEKVSYVEEPIKYKIL